jgi:hypoxanthine phosphoribosyltransferase
MPVTMDFMVITQYAQRTSGGVVRIVKDLDDEIHGRHVLVVEDIIDTGLTLNYLLQTIRARSPASLEVCTLLDRPALRIVEDLPVKYTGFEIADVFVVGYGLDYRQRYRNLPYIATLKEEAFENEANRRVH